MMQRERDATREESRRRGASPPASEPVPARSSTGNGQPLTERGLRTREKLLVAAREMFSRAGFSEVRVTDITALAGVASGTFYTYFDCKEEIFREIAAQVLLEMHTAPYRNPDRSERNPARQLENATRRYFESIRKNARIARSIEELHAREAGVGAARRDVLIKGVKRIERWIRLLQREGICDPELDPRPTALALQAMNVSVAYDHLVHRDAPEDTEELLRASMRIWCATLGLER